MERGEAGEAQKHSAGLSPIALLQSSAPTQPTDKTCTDTT